jgi:hypothetical protein
MSLNSRTGLSWVLLVLAIAVAWLSLWAQEPPRPLPADAPSDVFSARRAFQHVEEIARAPHPTGSAEAERVRGVLVQRLVDMGLKAEIQRSRDPEEPFQNVLARIPGRGGPGKKALLLCAHYDSRPEAPGAGDNGLGVAVVLETVRAIQAGPPLDRDLIALFDDGEEVGLDGARIFVEEHPWASDVGVVLNFDARGNSGSSFMFETSDGNGWLIREYARATPRPLAASLTMDVYRIMPNDTNLTVFKKAGLSGLNYAVVGGWGYYHTPDDTAARLDRRSLQHEGENALAMVRRLGHTDLEDPKQDDLIYFSIFNRQVFLYSRSWAVPLASVAAAMFVVVAAVGMGRGRIRILDLGSGMIVWIIAALAAIFAVGTFWVVFRDMLESLHLPWRQIDAKILLAACAAIAATVALILEGRAGRRRSWEALSVGALFWWIPGALASALWLPGGSYLFAWPALFGSLGLGASLLIKEGSAPGRVAIFLGSLPALILMPPLILNTFESLGLRMAALLMILVVLFLGGILPLLEPIAVSTRREAH